MSFEEMLDDRDRRRDDHARNSRTSHTALMSSLAAYLEPLGQEVARACAQRGRKLTPIGRQERRRFRAPKFIEEERAWQLDPRHTKLGLTEHGVWRIYGARESRWEDTVAERHDLADAPWCLRETNQGVELHLRRGYFNGFDELSTTLIWTGSRLLVAEGYDGKPRSEYPTFERWLVERL